MCVCVIPPVRRLYTWAYFFSPFFNFEFIFYSPAGRIINGMPVYLSKTDLRRVAQSAASLQAATARGEAVGGADGREGRRGHHGSSGPLQSPVDRALERRADASGRRQ